MKPFIAGLIIGSLLLSALPTNASNFMMGYIIGKQADECECPPEKEKKAKDTEK